MPIAFHFGKVIRFPFKFCRKKIDHGLRGWWRSGEEIMNSPNSGKEGVLSEN